MLAHLTNSLGKHTRHENAEAAKPWADSPFVGKGFEISPCPRDSVVKTG